MFASPYEALYGSWEIKENRDTRMKMKPGHMVGGFLRGLLGVALLATLVQGNIAGAGILLMSIGASGLVYYVCKHFLGDTGQWMDALFALLIVFNNLLGLVLDFYHTVPGWDIATHYTTSLFLAVSALILLQRAYPQVAHGAPDVLIVLGVVLFSLGLGGLWEIGEFASDFLRGTDFQHGLTNTMQDLIIDAVAGIVVGLAWAKRTK